MNYGPRHAYVPRFGNALFFFTVWKLKLFRLMICIARDCDCFFFEYFIKSKKSMSAIRIVFGQMLNLMFVIFYFYIDICSTDGMKDVQFIEKLSNPVNIHKAIDNRM